MGNPDVKNDKKVINKWDFMENDYTKTSIIGMIYRCSNSMTVQNMNKSEQTLLFMFERYGWKWGKVWEIK